MAAFHWASEAENLVLYLILTLTTRWLFDRFVDSRDAPLGRSYYVVLIQFRRVKSYCLWMSPHWEATGRTFTGCDSIP